jgi:uncharacterized protein
MSVHVEHDEAHHRFVVRLGNEEAEITYARPAPGVLDLQHTFVPESARGQGIAEALAVAAFDFARQHGDRVIPSCPFVRSWLPGHPEEAKLVSARRQPGGS